MYTLETPLSSVPWCVKIIHQLIIPCLKCKHTDACKHISLLSPLKALTVEIPVEIWPLQDNKSALWPSLLYVACYLGELLQLADFCFNSSMTMMMAKWMVWMATSITTHSTGWGFRWVLTFLIYTQSSHNTGSNRTYIR